jgi:hypothetical protein
MLLSSLLSTTDPPAPIPVPTLSRDGKGAGVSQ